MTGEEFEAAIRKDTLERVWCIVEMGVPIYSDQGFSYVACGSLDDGDCWRLIHLRELYRHNERMRAEGPAEKEAG